MRWLSKTNYKVGVLAEYVAALYLMFSGYRVITMRYKTKVGEIDIIAKKKNTIFFIEVKCRQTLDEAQSAVLSTSQSRIRRTAEHFILGNKMESPNIQFDVIAMNRKFRIRHIKNAF